MFFQWKVKLKSLRNWWLGVRTHQLPKLVCGNQGCTHIWWSGAEVKPVASSAADRRFYCSCLGSLEDLASHQRRSDRLRRRTQFVDWHLKKTISFSENGCRNRKNRLCTHSSNQFVSKQKIKKKLFITIHLFCK